MTSQKPPFWGVIDMWLTCPPGLSWLFLDFQLRALINNTRRPPLDRSASLYKGKNKEESSWFFFHLLLQNCWKAGRAGGILLRDTFNPRGLISIIHWHRGSNELRFHEWSFVLKQVFILLWALPQWEPPPDGASALCFGETGFTNAVCRLLQVVVFSHISVVSKGQGFYYEDWTLPSDVFTVICFGDVTEILFSLDAFVSSEIKPVYYCYFLFMLINYWDSAMHFWFVRWTLMHQACYSFIWLSVKDDTITQYWNAY